MMTLSAINSSARTTRQVAGGQAWVSPSFRSHAFWLVAYTFVVVTLGSTLPSLLYVIYQGRPLVC